MAETVSLLMATLNGATYLPHQLRSIGRQNYKNWRLIVSDDGSQDATHHILKSFQEAFPNRVQVRTGPKLGYAQNFLSLLRCAPPGPVAFVDQDDVWMQDKLTLSIKALARSSNGRPALYCARTVVCDANLGPTSLSLLPVRAPSFRNALVQNIAAGNTIVLNTEAAKVGRRAALHAAHVVSHDWWMYLLISGCGGSVIYDRQPVLYYRQHDQNAVGAATSMRARLRRFGQTAEGRYRDWIGANCEALSHVFEQLTPENQIVFQEFRKARHAGPLDRLKHLRTSGVYRHALSAQASLYAAAFVRRI